jgi:hypothetical protein
MDTECTHESAAERALVGSWVMDEVRLDVEKVLQVLEVYKYQVTQFDPSTGEAGLFAKYIDTFLKLKAEASGYPSWVTCPEDEDRYVASFMAKEGIDLDKACIQPNTAKRALVKLCLNSMWGKLTERNNRTKPSISLNPTQEENGSINFLGLNIIRKPTHLDIDIQ